MQVADVILFDDSISIEHFQIKNLNIFISFLFVIYFDKLSYYNIHPITMNVFETEYDDTHCIKNALCQIIVDEHLQASVIRNVPIQQATEVYGNLSMYSYDMLLNVKYNDNVIMTSYVPDVSHSNRHISVNCTTADMVFLHINYRRVLMNDKMLSYNLSGKSFEDIIIELDKVFVDNDKSET